MTPASHCPMRGVRGLRYMTLTRAYSGTFDTSPTFKRKAIVPHSARPIDPRWIRARSPERSAIQLLEPIQDRWRPAHRPQPRTPDPAVARCAMSAYCPHPRVPCASLTSPTRRHAQFPNTRWSIVDFDVGRSMGHTRDNPNDVPDANTIARCRELLGEEAEGLSDTEIDQIRRHADAVAHVIVEVFLEQRAAQE